MAKVVMVAVKPLIGNGRIPEVMGGRLSAMVQAYIWMLEVRDGI